MWLQSLAQLLSGPPTQSGSGNLTSPNNAEIHWSDVELSRSTAKKTWGGCCDSGSCSSNWPPAHHPTSRGNWSTGAPARQKIETRSWNKKKRGKLQIFTWPANSFGGVMATRGPLGSFITVRPTLIKWTRHIRRFLQTHTKQCHSPNNRWDGPLDWACQAWDRQSPPSQGIGGGAEHSHSPPSLHNWSEM